MLHPSISITLPSGAWCQLLVASASPSMEFFSSASVRVVEKHPRCLVYRHFSGSSFSLKAGFCRWKLVMQTDLSVVGITLMFFNLHFDSNIFAFCMSKRLSKTYNTLGLSTGVLRMETSCAINYISVWQSIGCQRFNSRVAVLLKSGWSKCGEIHCLISPKESLQ